LIEVVSVGEEGDEDEEEEAKKSASVPVVEKKGAKLKKLLQKKHDDASLLRLEVLEKEKVTPELLLLELSIPLVMS
jgi:hypothetical protein